MRVSAFYFIKDEWPWIAYSLASMDGHVDEIVVFDEEPGHDLSKFPVSKSRAFRYFLHKPIDVMNQKQYEGLFNDCLDACAGDWLLWLHADMVAYNAEILKSEIGRVQKAHPDAVHMSIRLKSFVKDLEHTWAGGGRKTEWPMIVRNGFGLHYHGAYGHPTEGFYFRDITGETHEDLWSTRTPYPIYRTNFRVAHFCEMKPRQRREEKMKRVLINQGVGKNRLDGVAMIHPRVSLEPNAPMGFRIVKVGKAALPEVFRTFDFGAPERADDD